MGLLCLLSRSRMVKGPARTGTLLARNKRRARSLTKKSCRRASITGARSRQAFYNVPEGDSLGSDKWATTFFRVTPQGDSYMNWVEVTTKKGKYQSQLTDVELEPVTEE